MAGRRIFIAAFAALLAIPALAGERLTADKIPAVSALQLAINQLFMRPEIPGSQTPGSAPEVPAMQMLVVRLKDGKPVIACVDSKEAAQRFLKAPVNKIGDKHTHAEEK